MKKYVFESLKFFCAAILCTILSAFTSPSWGALPSGYTELEYIESTGEQYIDTGYIPNSNTRWELDNEYTETPPTEAFFNGVYQAGRDYQPARFDIALGETEMLLNYGVSNVVNSNVSSFINTRYMYVVDAKNNKWAYNDTTGSFPSYSNMVTITKPLYLFARNDAHGDTDGVRRFSKQRTYSSKIYENGTLVRNFIPAKDSSGKIGMYDTVNNRFYTNAGTGEFIAGAPVTTNSCRNLFDIKDVTRNSSLQNIDCNISEPFTISCLNDNVVVSEPVWRLRVEYANGRYEYIGDPGYSFGFPRTFEATKDNPVIQLQIRSSAIVSGSYRNFQVEQGTTATPYQPYNPSCGCDGTVVNYTSATGTGVQNGTPTPDNPIEPVFYQQGNMVLRKVGDYADTYDATTGKITRRVGVAVLDGTETIGVTSNMLHVTKRLPVTKNEGWQYRRLCSHGVAGFAGGRTSAVEIDGERVWFGGRFGFTVETGRQWLAEQYAAGTPVTVWYPLAEETTEDWTETSYCETPIKIATTKYNESAFGPLNTALANAISVVDSVVTQTITQAGRIADLQAQKQTRPADDPTDANNAENCPAGKKCLLVEDASGTPHWYEIVEKYSRLPDGFTELEYIEGTGTQYIDTGVYASSNNLEIYLKTQANGDATNEQDIISNYGGSTTGRGVIGYYQNSIFAYARKDSREEKNSSVTPTNINDILDIYVNYDYNNSIKTLKVNGVANTTSYTQGVSTDSYTFDLFHQKSASTSNVFKGKMYYCKIIIDGILAFNGVPAKNSSGAIGMYDTVSGEFFTNKGSGLFIAGPVAE